MTTFSNNMAAVTVLNYETARSSSASVIYMVCQNILGTKAITFTQLNLLYVLLLLWKSRSSKSVRKGVRKEEQNCTLVASHHTPSTGALERVCEFFFCTQLEYCLREPLSKFEGLSTFYCNFIT